MSASCPEQLQSLEAWWNLRRGTRPMPRRCDFTPETLRPWLGNLSMVAVEHGPGGPRFRVTLSGTHLDEYRGFGITGRYIDELQDGSICSLPQFQACAAERRPIRFVHDNSRYSLIFRRMAKLLLPLADAGGQVSHILVSLYPLAANDAIAAERRVTA